MIDLLLKHANLTGRVQDYIGMGNLVAVMIGSVLVFPIVEACVLVYLWLRPMGEKYHQRLTIAVGVLSAWQYADFYLVSVFVASS